MGVEAAGGEAAGVEAAAAGVAGAAVAGAGAGRDEGLGGSSHCFVFVAA